MKRKPRAGRNSFFNGTFPGVMVSLKLPSPPSLIDMQVYLNVMLLSKESVRRLGKVKLTVLVVSLQVGYGPCLPQ